MLPKWMSVTILILALLIIAPYVMCEPLRYVRDKFRGWQTNRKFRKIARGIRKMAASKDPELSGQLQKAAEGLDELSKL